MPTNEEVVKATWAKVHPQGFSFLLRTGCLKQAPPGAPCVKLEDEHLVRFDLQENKEITGTFRDTSIFVYRTGG